MSGMQEMKVATTVSHSPSLFTPQQTASRVAIKPVQSNPPLQQQTEQRKDLLATQTASAQVFSLGARAHTHTHLS